MSLRTLFKSLLEPQILERFADTTISLKIIRLAGEEQASETVQVGPLPKWFTVYDLKVALWDLNGRDPLFSPPIVFIGIPNEAQNYIPLEMVWLNMPSSSSSKREAIDLVSPFELLRTGPDSRFVDSSGGQKAISNDNRIQMTLNDVFQIDKGKAIPELHVFLYADLIERIPGPRPLGERDVYGRIIPYFPFVDPANLPPASGDGVTTAILKEQADKTMNSLTQILYLENLLQTLGGELQMPTLDGVKFLRWVWSEIPDGWEGPAVVFFGTKVTHERPYMRFFSSSGQPLTKIRVRGVLPIPDLPTPNLLLTWKQDKNPDLGKDCTFIKLRVQEDSNEDSVPVYVTMRIFNDGTADLIILPPKQKRLLDPYSDLQDAPEILDRSFADMPYAGQLPVLGQADVVFKLRLSRDQAQITKSTLQRRLKFFSSIFQEIPPLPDEQPLAMLRYKGVSNFNTEDRIYAFLTQIAAHEIVEGDIEEGTWAPRVAQEFKISIDAARRKVVAWVAQRNEYTLAVPETRDYILNKNPGVDIAIYAQHPIYNLHMYRAESFDTYTVIVNLLGLLLTAPADRFTAPQAATAAQVVATVPPPVAVQPVAPVAVQPVAPVPVIEEPAEENDAVFFPNENDDVPEFMRAPAAPATDQANNDDIPEFMRAAEVEEPNETAVEEEVPAPVVAAPVAAAEPPQAIQDEEDKRAAAAFKKPTDLKAIAVKKYYIDKLKVADPDLFNYRREGTERGYVSHCAANESRQPVVLDKDEYREMRTIYEDDDDLTFILYPEDDAPAKFQKKQPGKDENTLGTLEGKPYPSEADNEIITLVRYGSKAKRINYYFCPRLFCIRDRLMVRYKDFKATVDRKGAPKPANTCPFCKGILVDTSIKDKDRDPRMSVLERLKRPGSETERQIYIGFLGKKKTSSGLSLPCCFADPSDRFNKNDPEFVRLGLRQGATAPAPPAPPAPVAIPAAAPAAALATVRAEAQPVADAIMGATVRDTEPVEEELVEVAGPILQKYEPNYYRVVTGVSVKSIVDANRIPLEIVVPKVSAPDDPKSGPQVGLLPDALDKYFQQDSASDKFASRLEIVRKLKPSAKGFLRLAVDNTSRNKPLAFFSAIAPFLYYQPTAEKVIETYMSKITPRQFLQLNGGNLVHEFFNKCERKHQNDMRAWVSYHVGIDELKSSNIPAIERLMNSYECFKDYINTPSERKDFRIFFQALSEPGIILPRGVLFIVLELTVEEITIKKGDKSEYKREVKFDRVRCPTYPLSEGQQKADIAFLIHYTEITHDRYNPEKKFRHLAWEPLFYVDGGIQTADTRHKPTLLFQRSQEASWPPIVQARVSEFFRGCTTINRGPFTSQFGMDPNALINAQEIIKGVRIQPNGIIRDSYNHLVGIGYRIAKTSTIVAVPIADDGSIFSEMKLFLDWDDFDVPPIDSVIDFYTYNITRTFPQYKGYVAKYVQKSRDTQKIIGLTLQNGFSIPAKDPKDPSAIADMRIVEVDDLEWDINRTIAYDDTLRKKAFKDAEEEYEDKGHVELKSSSIQDDIEDIYQHLRLTFSNWLAMAGAGRDLREALHDVLKSSLPLYEKRKRLDILLEDKITRWLEPSEEEVGRTGFLRVDCRVQDEAECSGRCKWASDSNTCKIHTPASIQPNGVAIQVPRLLYLRLVDELIRYASRREEIFRKEVPRLTIRKDAMRQGDQYIIPEGSADWNTWWELLRTDWMTPEKEEARFFDEQYEPIPSGLPTDDSRSLPDVLKGALGAADPKTSRLVWNPTPTPDRPLFFLKSILRNSPILEKAESTLSIEEMDEIVRVANVLVIYMPSGTMSGSLVRKAIGAIDAIIIAGVNGTIGWISQNGKYSVKLPLIALPETLNEKRLQVNKPARTIKLKSTAALPT